MEPNTPRAEAERWLGIASKLLASRDLVGSRSFAIRARESDPTNPISEQIIAIVDTLISAEKRVINSGHHDWYSILQLSHLARDLDLIASQYRRLVLLLNPDHNHFPFADYALRVVVDAWSVLSDPTKKWIYDSELSIFLQRNSAPPDPEPPTVRVDSSAAATYQFFQQPPPPQQQQQQQQWIHHLHQAEQQQQQQQQPQVQLQERQLFQQHHHPQPQQQQQQQQWLAQTQLQQLLPEQQRSSQPQWLPQSPQHQPHPPPQQPQPHRWTPPQPKEPQIPPPLQPHQPQPQPQQQQQQKKQRMKTPPPPPPPPPPPAPVQTPPFQPPPSPPQEPEPEPEPDRVTENGNKENDSNGSANNMNNDDENDDVAGGGGGEQIGSFWTACPYCYHLYEYSKTYHDCTLRCQKCRRAFQAIEVPGPPGNGRDGSFCSWGFFPLGFSMTNWKKKNNNANGFGSNWMPFSPMFACPVQEVKKKVWEIIDEDEDVDNLDDTDSDDDPDSSDDWGSTRKKVKRGKGRGRPRKKRVNGEKEKTAKNDGVSATKSDVVSGAKNDVSGNLRKQMGKNLRGRKKLDLNVEFSNEVEDPATVTREGNNGEEVVGFFEGLDEFLSTLPILHVVGDEKAKPS